MFFKRKITCAHCRDRSISVVRSVTDTNEIVDCCSIGCAEKLKARSIEIATNRLSWIKEFRLT